MFTLLIFGCANQPYQAQMPIVSSVAPSAKTVTPTLDGFSVYQTKRVATVIAIKNATPTPLLASDEWFPSVTPPLSLSPTLPFLPTRTQGAIWATYTPSPTPFLLKSKFLKACQDEFYDDYTKISPDGTWLAESCFDGTMQVSNQDGTKLFTVNNKDYFSDPYNPGLSGSVTPVHWTKDSSLIYFTVFPEQWNDGVPSIDGFAPLLGRMDVKKGEIFIVFGGTLYHSFSPTDRRLVLVQEFKHPVKLIIRDLKTGLEQTLIPDNNPKYGQAGGIVWDPDGLKFVFVAGFGREYGDEVSEPNVQALILVDLSDLSQQTIISEIPDFIEPISWDENGIITYRITNYMDYHQVTTYTYDHQRQEITVLPSPAP
jgi:hypothetical protein